MTKRDEYNMNMPPVMRTVFTIVTVFTTILILSLASMGHAETHPIWDKTGNVSDLEASVASYVNMTDSQLQSQLNTQGKADPHNIEMVDITYNFALLYHLTGSASYGHKATVLLDRYADVFPSWPLDYSDSRGHYMWWDDWFHRDLGWVARYLAEGYDLLLGGTAMEDYASGTTERIKTLLKQIVQVDLGYQLFMFNAAGYRPLGFMVFGRVLDDPELVHMGFWYYNKMIHEQYCVDGFYLEGNYEYMASNVSSLTDPIYEYYFEGYSDPVGYTHVPFEEKYDPVRIDNLDMSETFGDLWNRMQDILWKTALPDLNWPVMNETFAFPIGYSSPKYTPNRSILDESRLMNGVGHAALTFGSGSGQTQARLDFSHHIGHQHYDALHLIYYAKGEEVIGGTGYSYQNRDWNTTTMNQNLVVVNRADQKSDVWTDRTDAPYKPLTGRISGQPQQLAYPNTTMHNNLVMFEPGYKGDKSVQVVEVDAKDNYADLGVSRYSRMLALVNIAGDDMYMVDFFRVKGGSQYDWVIHGGHESPYTPVHPSYTSSTSLSMGSASGSLGLINYNGSSSTSNTWYGEYDYAGITNRFTMVGESGTTIYRGTAPKSGKQSSGNQDYFVAHRAPGTGTDENYLVVHETYSSSWHVQSVEKLGFSGDPGTAVGVKVTLDNGVVDYIVHTMDNGPSFPSHSVLDVDNFTVKGRFVHIRVTNGQVTWIKLLQGESVTFQGQSMAAVDGEYNYRGTVTRVNRKESGSSDNSFLVNTTLPSSGELNGKTLIVTWGNGWNWSYKIKSVSGSKIITDDEPGFEYSSGGIVDMKYFPEGTYSGPVTFTIPGSAYMDETGYVVSTKGDGQLVDETPPAVINTTPVNQQNYVENDNQIEITFSETMNTQSVESALSVNPSAQFSYSWLDNKLIITPTSPLAATTNYTLTISSSAVDMAGNSLDGNGDGVAGDNYSMSFTTASPPEPFYLYLEAETATASSPFEVVADANASGGECLALPEGVGNGVGEASISFEVPYTDTYYMWGRVIAPTASDDSYYISINGDYDRTWDVLYEEHFPDWTWDQVAERGSGTFDGPEFDPATFSLNAGTFTLTIKNREDGIMLDQILITNDASFIPDGVQTQTYTYNFPAGYSTIAVPLHNDGISSASELATAIETQLGANTVNGLSYWNTETQRYVSFAPHLPSFLQGTNFTISCGLPVLANTTTAGNWTLDGSKVDICYSLQKGYNLIALELDKDTITNASELAAAIETQLGSNSVNGISYWDKTTQRWVSFAPHLPTFLQGTNFSTSPGQAFLINVLNSGEF